ncbi:lysozyme inhibitor LprI family protein [Trinickia fusca]|nr:lysozyme inhibitor LprI family protein [Trinickia fusca]
MKRFAALFLGLTLCGVSVASKICDSTATEQLEACAKSNYAEADGKLNSAYKDLLSKTTYQHKNLLVTAQQNWIKYKEKYCQDAFDATSPGQEAGIDRWSCLEAVTRARERELQYFALNDDLSDFYHAVDFVARTYEGGDRDKVIKKINFGYPSKDDGLWLNYVEENCKLASAMFHEDRLTCVARQNFYRDWSR